MISEVIVRSSLKDSSTHKIVALCYQLKTKDKVRNFQIHRTKQQVHIRILFIKWKQAVNIQDYRAPIYRNEMIMKRIEAGKQVKR